MNRKSLRKKVIEILKAANHPIFGSNIFPNRSIPTGIDVLPVILVYSKNAPVTRRDESPKSYIISQDIVIECITQHDDDEKLSDELDDISDAVINIIEDDFYLEQNTEDVTLTSILTDTEADGQSPVGSTKITYTFRLNYYPREDLILDDLKGLDNNFNITDNVTNAAKSFVQLRSD